MNNITDAGVPIDTSCFHFKFAHIPSKCLSYIFFGLTLLGFGLAWAYFQEAQANHHKLLGEDVQWNKTLTAAKVGRWSLDVEANVLMWDDVMFDIFGVDKETWLPTYEGFSNTLDSNDVGWVNTIVLHTLESKTSYRAVFKLKNGLYVRAYGKVINSNGKIIFAGICIPATSAEYTGKPLAVVSEGEPAVATTQKEQDNTSF
jgi:hypothetical protein